MRVLMVSNGWVAKREVNPDNPPATISAGMDIGAGATATDAAGANTGVVCSCSPMTS